MFYEYAVDPSLLADPNASSALTERFGWPKGRLIAEYPSKWLRYAHQAIEGSPALPVQKYRLKRRLELLGRHLVRRAATRWDANSAWFIQALAEHERVSFHAIVTAGRGADAAASISWEADDPDVGLWAVPGGVTSRSADAIADEVFLLAASASRVLLVDPHFDPCAGRFTATLQAILVRLGRPPVRGPVPIVELHTSLGNARQLGELDAEGRRKLCNTYLGNCSHRLPLVVPADVKLSVTVWAAREGGQGYHNRYVLTEHGGIALGTGLDAGRAGANESDDLHRLTKEQHERHWANLTTDAGPYDLVAGPVPIRGSAPPLYSRV